MKTFILCMIALLALAEAKIDVKNAKPAINPAPWLAHVKRFPLEPKIIGGQEATIHQFPHQVAIYFHKFGSTFFCGGSVVSENYVMTAAHCCNYVSSFELRFGAHMVLEQERDVVTMEVDGKEAILHPGWSGTQPSHDICLIKTPSKIPIDNKIISKIDIVGRDQVNETFAGNEARISGWGKTSDSTTVQGANETSPVLRFIDQEVITNSKCKSYYGNHITDQIICISGEGKRSTCAGDSGSPMTINTNGLKQIGIASFVFSVGCEFGIPAGFIRLTEYLDWIEENSDVQIN